MSKISEIAESLASGSVSPEEARKQMRQVSVRPAVTSSNPYIADDDYEIEGTFHELLVAAMRYDLTPDEYEILRTGLATTSAPGETFDLNEAEEPEAEDESEPDEPTEEVEKHGGPGKHKNGTGQEVHGSGSRDATPSDMLSRARSQGGGASIHVLTGEQPTSGYAVAVSGLGIEVDPESVTPEMVGRFRAKHYSYFEQDEYVLGLWESPNTGQLWLDVTKIIDDRQEAIDMMMNSTEEGIWDFAAGDEIMREDVAKRRRRASLLASLIKRNRSNP